MTLELPGNDAFPPDTSWSDAEMPCAGATKVVIAAVTSPESGSLYCCRSAHQATV